MEKIPYAIQRALTTINVSINRSRISCESAIACTKRRSDLSQLQTESLDQAVQEFEGKKLELLQRLIIELLHAQPNPDAKVFGELFRHARRALGKSDFQMSQLFKVSRPTVGRWVRGVTAPHPLTQQAVFDVLLSAAKDELKTQLQLSAQEDAL